VHVGTAIGRYGVTQVTTCPGADAAPVPDLARDRFAALSIDTIAGTGDPEVRAAHVAVLDALVPVDAGLDVVTVSEVPPVGPETTVRTWTYLPGADRCAVALDLVAQLRALGYDGMALSTVGMDGTGSIWAAMLSNGEVQVGVGLSTADPTVAVRVGAAPGPPQAGGTDMPCAV
jgi:hypothetical protein